MIFAGRRVEHDPRSRSYAYQPRYAASASVMWTHHAPILDQGWLGSCVGNAMAQCLNTTVFSHHRPRRRYLTETDAVALYSAATTLDDYPGTYPPEDTGSSGLAVAKAAAARGYITRYDHCFGLDHMIQALQSQPVIVGTVWTQDMMSTDSRGFVHPTGKTVGGHEYLCLGVNLRDKYLTFLNSWSDQWGRQGRFRVRFDDFTRLLADDGDVTVPILED